MHQIAYGSRGLCPDPLGAYSAPRPSSSSWITSKGRSIGYGKGMVEGDRREERGREKDGSYTPFCLHIS